MEKKYMIIIYMTNEDYMINLLISFASSENIKGPLLSTTKINNPNIIKGESPPKPIK